MLLTLYNSIILPYLSYCNVAWGNTCRSYLDRLRVLQKKSIRCITNSNYRHPSSPLFLRLRLLPLEELVSLNCVLFMFKLQFLPHECVLIDMFLQNSKIHNYNTRQRDLIHQPVARTNVTLNSFHISCIREWNSLPVGIKNSVTLSSFKRLSKTYLLERLR